MNTEQDTLQTLIDKQALHELVMTYCRAVDRRDYELMKTIYHPDAREDRGAIFTGPAEGFIAMAAADSVNYEATIHRIFNTFFKVSGNTAQGEIYVEAYHRTSGENAQEIIAGGRFLDQYEKRNNRWGIVARTGTMDCCQSRPVNPDIYKQFVAGSIPGEPGKNDISYKTLSLFANLGN